MDDILITDALIVTCDGNHSIIENGVMAVNNGKITALEHFNTSAAKKLTAKKIIGANGNIVMPGLINMHCHAADSLFRGLVENLPETGAPGIFVSITNHGEGIPAQEIPRLTERFYRVDKGRSRSMGGTGLGLAIVKHIVARHRGHLEVKSEVNKETSFTVMLPRSDENIF